MFNAKEKFVTDYRNIIIVVLLLAIFFTLSNIIFDRKAFADSHNQQQDKGNHILYKAINHVFPGGDLQSKNTALEGIKGIYSSLANSVFFLDLKNPYTFISRQFPGMNLYNDKLAMNINSDVTEKKSQPVTSQDFTISFEEDGSFTPVVNIGEGNGQEKEVEQDRDDLGELVEGIYIHGTEDVIDSRNNPSLSLEGIDLPNKIKFEEGKPHVLIYHTHGTESYKPASEGNYHTLRKEYSVISVAEIIAKDLEKQGFNVIHDTTYHDYPSYNGSYSRSLSTAQEILEKNPSIKVILDIHRDGYDNIETSPNRNNIILNNQAVFNNQTMSKFQLVIGPESPNRGEVETFAKYVKAVSDQRFPGFSKAVLVKPYGRFNQFLVDHYALLELGSNANTIEEAKVAAHNFAEVLGEALKNISK